MSLEDAIAKRYSLYLALHKARQTDPDTFSDGLCNVIFTAIQGGHRFGWRVVGITKNALRRFEELKFCIEARRGMTRAHIHSRIETTRLVICRPEPLSAKELTDILREKNDTVLCYTGENRRIVPEFIKIDNKCYDLFAGRGLVGWYYGDAERSLIKRLCHEHLSSE